jgi:hypothetical protein
LHCWHFLREFHSEDEEHVFFACPAYSAQRRDLITEVTAECASGISAASSMSLLAILQSHHPADWEALGKFTARVRQLRRKMKESMQRLSVRREREEFNAVKRAWRRRGAHVCRHGVFLNVQSVVACPCTVPRLEADWSQAVLMPALDPLTKCIITDTFDPLTFRRLGVLQAETRRLRW